MPASLCRKFNRGAGSGTAARQQREYGVRDCARHKRGRDKDGRAQNSAGGDGGNIPEAQP